MSNEILQKLVESIEYIQKIFPEEAPCIFVIDHDKVLGKGVGEKMKLDSIQVGTPTTDWENTTVVQSVRTGKSYRWEMDTKNFGHTYVTTSTPIFDEKGHVIGAISAVVSNETRDMLREKSRQLTKTVGDISSITEEFIQNSVYINEKLKKITDSMTEDIIKIFPTLATIREFAERSTLVGLNASIEASRAGENGEVFGVIAREIKNMSVNSQSAAKKANEEIERLQSNIHSVEEMSKEIEGITQKFLNDANMINENFKEILKASEDILKASRVNEK